MGTPLLSVHIQRGNTTLRECATTATILKVDKSWQPFADILTEWLTLEECAIVVTKLKNGKRDLEQRAKIPTKYIKFDFYVV